MRRAFLLAVSMVMIGAATAAAAQFGPLKSSTAKSGLYAGGGYTYMPAKWEASSVGTIKTTQNQVFGQFGMFFGKGFDLYLRGGVADWSSEEAFRFSTSKASDDPKPFAAIGLSVPLFEGKTLAIGPFVQGSYFSEYNSRAVGVGVVTDSLGNPLATYLGTEKISFKNSMEISAGVKFQTVIEGATLYFGPAYFLVKSKIRSEFSGTNIADATDTVTDWQEVDIESANQLGGFAGIQWQLQSHYNLSLESQVRDGVAFGASLNYLF